LSQPNRNIKVRTSRIYENINQEMKDLPLPDPSVEIFYHDGVVGLWRYQGIFSPA